MNNFEILKDYSKGDLRRLAKGKISEIVGLDDDKIFRDSGRVLGNYESVKLSARIYSARCVLLSVLVLLMLPAAVPASALALTAAGTSRVSVGIAGAQSGGPSDESAISADGRYVAFVSTAPNLVEGDTNGTADAFVRDTRLDTTERVSVALNASQPNAAVSGLSLSSDGRFVLFLSSASNLVPGDTNGCVDAFVYDRGTHAMRRVNVASDGGQANWDCRIAQISGDGQHVVFSTQASNLVPGDTNGTWFYSPIPPYTPYFKPGWDVFVHHIASSETERVSAAREGYPYDGGGLVNLGYGALNVPRSALSPDGRFVCWYGNSGYYLFDCLDDSVEFLTSGTAGYPGMSITPDARFVVYSDGSPWGPDVYVLDRQTDVKKRVAQYAGQWLGSYGITDDGRSVLYSGAVTGDTNGKVDLFLFDVMTGSTRGVGVATGGIQANGTSRGAAISPGGRYISFISDATNLVVGDTNGVSDVFLRDLEDPIDATPPVSELSGAHEGWTSSDVVVSLTATDGAGVGVASTVIGIGEGVPQLYTGSVRVSDEGTTTIRYYSVDHMGNRETTRTSLVRIDKSAPITISDARQVYLTSAEIKLSAGDGGMSGVADTRWRLDGAGGWKSGLSVSITAIGTHALEFYSEDTLGNAELPRTAIFIVLPSVNPKARLSRSTSWKSLRRSKTYYAKGYIAPRHATGDPNKVRVRAYKKSSNGTYNYVKSFTAKYSYYSSTKTRYKASVKLTSRGKWKLVAYHATDTRNAKTYGSADYVTVK